MTIPPPTRKGFFAKEKLLPNLALVLVIIASTVYAYYKKNVILEVLTTVLLAILLAMFLARFFMEYVLASQSKTINFIMQLLYTFIGFPMLVIAGMFLPLSIFVFFFNYENDFLVSLVLLLTGIVELAAIIYVVRKGLKEKNMSVWEYIRSTFSIEKRIQTIRETKEIKKQTEQYYTTLEIAGEKAAERVKKREVQYQEFDLEGKIKDLCENPVEYIPCWNCQTLNPIDRKTCEKCEQPLKLRDEKKEQKIAEPKYQLSIVKEHPLAPITRYCVNITIASVLFATSGILGVLSSLSIEDKITVIDYSKYLILALSLAPIGFSIHYIAQDYFEDHIVRAAYWVDRIFFIFSFVVVVNMLLLGFPAFATVAYIMTVIVRVLGFYSFYKAMGKIKRIKKVNVGGWIYLVYALYDVLISLFIALAQFPLIEDDTLVNFLQAYKLTIDALITIIVAIKIIMDVWRIREYVKREKIEPKGFETSWILRSKVERGEIAIVRE